MTATTQTIPARVDVRYVGGMAATASIDVRTLRRRLEEEVEGEVRFDTGSKALYATDASNYRQVPLGVVIPKTLEDVVATHRVCHEIGAPVLAHVRWLTLMTLDTSSNWIAGTSPSRYCMPIRGWLSTWMPP